MSILLTPISGSALAELNRRKAVISSPHATRNDLLWLHGKTPWIKMQSNALFSDSKNAPSSYTLTSEFGVTGTLKFEDANTPIELKPRPGIVSLSSTIKGHLGVMREVNVKFKAYTLFQLEQLQELFMVPGIGVLVEWGWARADMDSISIPLRSTWPKNDDDKWLKNTILNKIQQGSGNYDALFGLICNFNYTFVDDGTWDCETTIVGPGAMTVDINLKSRGNALDEKLSSYFEQRINEHMKGINPDKDESEYGKCGTFNGIESNIALYVSPAEQQKTKQGDKTPKDTSKTNMYVTWEFIENTLNSFFSTAEKSNYAGKKFIASSIAHVNKDGSGKDLPAKQVIPCNSFAYDSSMWRSFNPTEMVIPQHPPTVKSFGNEIVLPVGRKQIRSFDGLNNLQYGDLQAVWLNWNTLVKPALQDSETINDALNKLLNKMNDSAGGLWDLQLMFNDENYESYKVIDFKCTYGMKNDALPYIFDMNVKNSYLREAEVSLTVPNALKATVMIAANSDIGADSQIADRDMVGVFRSLTRGVKDRYARPAFLGPTFQPNGQLTSQTRPTPLVGQAGSGLNAAINDPTGISTPQTPSKDLENKVRNTGWNVELSGDEKGAAINFIFRTIENANSSNRISALIPLELTIKIDGISGLRWGNAFNVSYLPTKYRENAVFQIKDISHDVTPDAWVTTIVGLMRPKYNGVAVAIANDHLVDGLTSDGSAKLKQSGLDKTGGVPISESGDYLPEARK